MFVWIVLAFLLILLEKDELAATKKLFSDGDAAFHMLGAMNRISLPRRNSPHSPIIFWEKLDVMA